MDFIFSTLEKKRSGIIVVSKSLPKVTRNLVEVG